MCDKYRGASFGVMRNYWAGVLQRCDEQNAALRARITVLEAGVRAVPEFASLDSGVDGGTTWYWCSALCGNDGDVFVNLEDARHNEGCPWAAARAVVAEASDA